MMSGFSTRLGDFGATWSVHKVTDSGYGPVRQFSSASQESIISYCTNTPEVHPMSRSDWLADGQEELGMMAVYICTCNTLPPPQHVLYFIPYRFMSPFQPPYRLGRPRHRTKYPTASVRLITNPPTPRQLPPLSYHRLRRYQLNVSCDSMGGNGEGTSERPGRATGWRR